MEQKLVVIPNFLYYNLSCMARISKSGGTVLAFLSTRMLICKVETKESKSLCYFSNDVCFQPGFGASRCVWLMKHFTYFLIFWQWFVPHFTERHEVVIAASGDNLANVSHFWTCLFPVQSSVTLSEYQYLWTIAS